MSECWRVDRGWRGFPKSELHEASGFGVVLCCKLRSISGMLGEFWAHFAFFWLAWVGRNHFINTKFTENIMEIADSSHGGEERAGFTRKQK